MRMRLSTKISAVIVAVVVVAILSSTVALLSARGITRLLSEIAKESLPAQRAAEELEIALLEEKEYVARQVLAPPDSRPAEEPWKKEDAFDRWLADANRTAQTGNQREILVRLEAVYAQCSAERDRALALHRAGEMEKAQRHVAGRLGDLYGQAHDLCERFIDLNVEHVEAANFRVDRGIRGATTAVTACVGLTVALGGVLLWLFFYGILRPLRQMAADAGLVARNGIEGGAAPHDELAAVGLYLRSLMTDVADTRSRLEQSRQRLQNAEKLAAVGRLAASVAHEIRNPLTAIKMWLFSIQKSVRGDEELERKLAIISDEITRLESIVRSFLEFSRPPALRPCRQEIRPLVDKTLELLCCRIEQRGVRLACRIADGLPPVMADAEQLRQVFINLLNNALDATPEGGEIRVSAARAVEPNGVEAVVVRIEDTGRGMPEDVRQRIFEPFYSTKEGGTGLGLCIAAGIMARHEGRLVLETSGPAGTTFAVWVPTAREGSS